MLKKGVSSRHLHLAPHRGKRLEDNKEIEITDRDMFDTMTLTKIAGAFCTALLVLVMGGWVADKIYEPGHHGEDHGVAWIETDSGIELAAVIEEGPSFGEFYAVADPAKGERVFRKCSACHKLEDGANGTGPHLFGIVDRAVGSVEGFGYSGALVAVAESWTVVELNEFLEKPKQYAPGTAMGFNGLPKAEDRANLIAYMATFAQ